MHLFLVANLVTTSVALVPTSDALVSNSEHCYYFKLGNQKAILTCIMFMIHVQLLTHRITS